MASPSRTGLLRAAGLILVVGIVAGALVVRLGGPGDPGTPTPVLAPDSATSPESTAGPDTTAGLDTTAAPAVSGDTALRAPADAAPGPGAAADTVIVATSDGDARATVADSVSESGSLPDPQPDSEPDTDTIYVPPTPPGGWAAATEPSPLTLEPVADSLRVPEPEAVRGIYVGSWSAGTPSRLSALLALADDTEVNAFVVDIKDVTGEVTYRTEVPLAVQVEADRRVRIRDVGALLDSLRAHGVYPIARIVAFKDPLLAVARPEWGVERTDGEPWVDDNDVHWVDSFNRNVWDYNIELAREAVALGFQEVQWDYVRFPDVPSTYHLEAVYPAAEGRSMTQGIREFLGYAGYRLSDFGVPMTADVFGITTSTHRDIGIGQVWEMMSDQVDVLQPMVYPSHYPPNSWDYPNPNAAPYQIVRAALDAGVERSDTIPDAAAIRPWLQAFSLGEPEYTARHIRAQIDATYDAGLTEWLLWNPGVRYPVEAFVDANGIEPWFAGMGETLYPPDDRGEAGDSVPGASLPGDTADRVPGHTAAAGLRP